MDAFVRMVMGNRKWDSAEENGRVNEGEQRLK